MLDEKTHVLLKRRINRTESAFKLTKNRPCLISMFDSLWLENRYLYQEQIIKVYVTRNLLFTFSKELSK